MTNDHLVMWMLHPQLQTLRCSFLNAIAASTTSSLIFESLEAIPIMETVSADGEYYNCPRI